MILKFVRLPVPYFPGNVIALFRSISFVYLEVARYKNFPIAWLSWIMLLKRAEFQFLCVPMISFFSPYYWLAQLFLPTSNFELVLLERMNQSTSKS